MSGLPEVPNLYLQIDRILAAIHGKSEIYLIAVVGIPGSGKSTLCDALAKRLLGSVVLPMDGYHWPRCQLTPEELKRRGAPHTFDSAKLRADLAALRHNHCGSFPAFDHSVKDPEPNAIHVGSDCSRVIVEGNYLLLKEWNLEELFDFTIFLDCDLEHAMDRVRQRLFSCGITPSPEEAAAQVQYNDLINAHLILDDGAKDRAQLLLLQA